MSKALDVTSAGLAILGGSQVGGRRNPTEDLHPVHDGSPAWAHLDVVYYPKFLGFGHTRVIQGPQQRATGNHIRSFDYGSYEE